MTVADLQAKLADIGARRKAALTAKANASKELAELIPRAIDAGITPTEISRLTGVSKQGVYDFRRQHQ